MESAASKPKTNSFWNAGAVSWERAPVFSPLVSAFLVTGVVGFLGVLFLVAPEQIGTGRAARAALLALIAIAAWFLQSRGKVKTAAVVLVVGTWTYVTAVCIFTGGLHATPVLLYPLIIMMTGWRLGGRAAAAIAGLTVATCVGLFLAQAAGVLPVAPPTPPASLLAVQIIVFVFAAYLVNTLVRSYRGHLDDLTRLSDDLTRRTFDLEAGKAELDRAQAVGNVGSWNYDIATDTMRLSAEACHIFGLHEGTRGSVAAYMALVHPDDRDTVDHLWQAALNGQAFDHEHRLMIGQKTIWVRQKTELELAANGGPVHAVGIVQDITERKEAERNLRLAVEVTRVILWQMDIPSQQLKFDRGMLPALGLNPGEDLATLTAWLERVHPDEAGLFMERFQAALQPGDPLFDLEYRLRRQDGQYEWIHTRGSVIQRSQEGQPEIAVGTSMNITARKLVEAELERHHRHLEELVELRTTELLATEARATRILEASADGLFGVDIHGRATFVNAACCRMLGYHPEQVIGRSAHDLFHHSRPDGSPFPADECRGRQAWQAGEEARFDDIIYWHTDGHPVPVEMATRPVVEKGVLVGAVVSIVDRSAQRAAAQARENALVAAENLARARSEFLANMSHEIRTPMNGVLGFAQIGQRNYKDPDKARNAFEKILTSGNQLLGVVNEILDFSKIDAGKLHVEASEMSLDDALDHALELVADRARAKGLDLRLEKAADLPSSCIGDPLRLGQVLLNLLTNAVKFTEAGSVTLSAALQGGQLVFRVTDTGIGMTPDQLGYVFNPFQQADGSTTRKFGGTGLGLAICKRLVELMQGEIRVESTPGAGSRFEVRLPCVEPATHPATGHAPPVTLPDKPLAGISILLAEDDPINQLMLEVNLEDDGARLVIVGDGATAVERVIADGPQAYDIVLMDLQMPVMDGYEATRRILELAPGLPIIGQTAHAFGEDRDKCLAAGMAAHIAKPIDPQALVTLVLRVLAERRRE